jgi:glutathione S-transferase
MQLDRYKYSDRYEESEVFYRDGCMWFLKLLNQQIGKKDNLFTDTISLTDIAIFPFDRQFTFVNMQYFDLLGFHALQKWLGWHIQSDLFLRIMKKNTIWSEPD